MPTVRFEEAVKAICRNDRRYTPDGYHFLRDALDHTVKKLRSDELIEHQHVSGPELVGGLVELALQEYGSMAVSVFDTWGIRSDEDVGNMVFNLIGEGAFGRSEEDSPEDFRGVLDIREALLAPYRPARRFVPRRPKGDEDNGNEPPARGNQPARPSEL